MDTPQLAVTQSGSAVDVDLGAMTPREAADRLFNRVMEATERGDEAEATSFLPMALQAYELARPLDPDGLFHLSLLQRGAGDPEGALTSALEGLQASPENLLNLSAAAEAALAVGDTVAARGYYSTLLEAWTREMAAGRAEYGEHSNVLPSIRAAAERFMAGGAP